MPYAPAVTDRSGEIRAQGIQQGLSSLADGFRQFAQNQAMSKTAVGKFQGALAADKSMLDLFAAGKAPPEAQAAFQKLQTKGSLALKDAAMLATFAESFAEQKRHQLQQQAIQQELDAAKRKQADEEAQRAAFNQFSNLQGGIGRGVYSNDVQQRQQQNAVNPFFKHAAMLHAATGKTPSPDTLADFAMRQQVPGKSMPEEISLPSGAKVAFSPSTGAFSVLPQTPKQLADAEAAKSEADLSAKGASTFLTDITDGAEVARNTISSVDRITSLYKQGAQSGFAQPVITQARSAFARFGLGQGIENQQQFEQELQRLSIEGRKQWMKGTGQVSDYETKMVEKAQANPNLTPESNLRILMVARNAADRAIKLDQLRMELEDQGLSNVEIARRLKRARDQMPIGIESIMDLATTAAVQAASGSAPAAPEQPAKPLAPLEIKAIRKLK